jgi:hypothetical protein
METRSMHQYQPAPGPAAQILEGSAIVAKAIARHRREAALQARVEEAHAMEALHRGGLWDGPRDRPTVPDGIPRGL